MLIILERGDGQHELRTRPIGLTCGWGRNFTDTPCSARDTKRLEARAAVLEQKLAQTRAVTKGALESGVPRLFLIADEFRQTMLRTELAWIRSLIDELQARKITWNWRWLRKVAGEFEPPR